MIEHKRRCGVSPAARTGRAEIPSAWKTFSLLLSILPLVACGRPAFPQELFTLDLTGADYPVMLSESPSEHRGRPIQAKSGTHAAASSQSYRSGAYTVTVNRVESSASELPASVKLAAQVHRKDTWVQIKGITWASEDLSGYGFSRSDRTLSVEGSAHK